MISLPRFTYPEGTVVVLSLLRPDENRSLDVSITRGEIKIPAASLGDDTRHGRCANPPEPI